MLQIVQSFKLYVLCLYMDILIKQISGKKFPMVAASKNRLLWKDHRGPTLRKRLNVQPMRETSNDIFGVMKERHPAT